MQGYLRRSLSPNRRVHICHVQKQHMWAPKNLDDVEEVAHLVSFSCIQIYTNPYCSNSLFLFLILVLIMQRYLDSSISLAKIRLKIHIILFCLPLKGFYRIIYYPNILKFCYLYSVFISFAHRLMIFMPKIQLSVYTNKNNG